MNNIKKKEIGIYKSNGWFQVTILGYCVTNEFRTRDAAYKDYIVKLLKAQNTAKKCLDSVPTWAL